MKIQKKAHALYSGASETPMLIFKLKKKNCILHQLGIVVHRIFGIIQLRSFSRFTGLQTWLP